MAELTVLSWNLFHGRDAPPDPALQRMAWRLSGRAIDNGTYLQVNHSLHEEFTTVIAAARWSICLLQEAPPAWGNLLGKRSQAEVFRSLTSRNQFAPLTQCVARRRPDLIGSWEGGSNTTLVRSGWRIVPHSARALPLSPLRERGLGERRRMAFARLRLDGAAQGGEEVCVANLHAAQRSRLHAERQVLRAAEAALEWADGAPLVLGGDFNLRPRTSAGLFERLERELGLAAPTAANAIDHLLTRGLRVIRPPTPWPAPRRDIEVAWQGGTRRIRLSDHTPIEAGFGIAR